MSAKIKVLVVEDEVIIALTIRDVLTSLGYEVLRYATSFEEAVSRIENDAPDIALLDINLAGKKSGIDVARKIKSSIDIPFIFLTSKTDSDTIHNAKLLNPNAYLAKPFTKDDLYASIELALHNFQTDSSKKLDYKKDELIINDALFVKDNNLYHKIKFCDILYIKSEHVYVDIYTKTEKRYLVRSSMNDFVMHLPSNFFRVHRSYTINTDFIEAIGNSYVFLEKNKIPIGKNYRNTLMKSINIK